MRSTRFLPQLLCAAVAALTLSCSDSSGPGQGDSKDPAQLNIIRLADTSPPLFNAVDSFYAVRGEDRELRIFFADIEGKEGEEYLRLKINAQSLLARPDGTPINEGDSVLVHVQVADPTQLLFDMQPTGLHFSPSDPAELKIHYDHANDDFNDDGRTDEEDDSIETTLGIWRQENPGDPFVRLGSAVVENLKEINAELQGFSRYALAY
jgi:hypothetical protein